MTEQIAQNVFGNSKFPNKKNNFSLFQFLNIFVNKEFARKKYFKTLWRINVFKLMKQKTKCWLMIKDLKGLVYYDWKAEIIKKKKEPNKK